MPETGPDDSIPAGPPRLAVVIVNYNSWDDVRRLIADLSSSIDVARGRAEILVVDNASPEPLPDDLRSVPAGVRLILRDENGGFAAGVNAGWSAARGAWLLVLNPDVVPDGGFLAAVLARVDGDEATAGRPPGIVGFGLRNPDGSPQPSVGAFPGLLRTGWEQLIPRSRRKYQPDWRVRPGPVDWVTGACVLFHPRMLAEVGGMDEEFFLYYEEVALCRSARDHGWRVEYDPALSVVHLRPLQNRPISPKMRVITRHSKLLFFRKHLPRWQFLGLARVVALEAYLKGAWASARRNGLDARAWGAIGEVARRMERGESFGGRAVLALAEETTGTG